MRPSIISNSIGREERPSLKTPDWPTVIVIGLDLGKNLIREYKTPKGITNMHWGLSYREPAQLVDQEKPTLKL